jgi:eukaryotic-like serine/threonine-protein kinase
MVILCLLRLQIPKLLSGRTTSIGDTPQVLVQGPFNAGGARFSPDGHWMAYVSDESGRTEVYLRAYPQAGPRIQISVEGGTAPVWWHNGRELFFRNGDQVFAVSMIGAQAVAGKPQVSVFEIHC